MDEKLVNVAYIYTTTHVSHTTICVLIPAEPAEPAGGREWRACSFVLVKQYIYFCFTTIFATANINTHTHRWTKTASLYFCTSKAVYVLLLYYCIYYIYIQVDENGELVPLAPPQPPRKAAGSAGAAGMRTYVAVWDTCILCIYIYIIVYIVLYI